MPEVIFNGPAGRLEGRLHPSKNRKAPIALILHPHPRFGGTMNNEIIYNLYYMFARRGFTVLRFNFRGVVAHRAHLTMALASFPMRQQPLTGFRPIIRRLRASGLQASLLEPGSACSF